MKPPFIPEDSRIVDSTGALELKNVPKKMLVLGGGIIGLEMATVYSVLGARIDVVEMLDGLMLGADRDLVRVWDKMNARRFDRVMLKTKTVKAEALKEGIKVWFGVRTHRMARSFTIWCWSPPGARRMARTSPPTRPVLPLPIAVSSK